MNTYGKTKVTTTYPWGTTQRKGTRLLCSDGKIRNPAYLASTPDTYFSTHAAMQIKGKYVTGYMTTEEAHHDTLDFDIKAYVFRHHLNKDAPLPDWARGTNAATTTCSG
jgi:hypothetical protein